MHTHTHAHARTREFYEFYDSIFDYLIFVKYASNPDYDYFAGEKNASETLLFVNSSREDHRYISFSQCTFRILSNPYIP